MRSLIKAAFTGKDNETVDIGRVIWAFLSSALSGLEAHAVLFLHQPFDAVQFATASAAILTAGGVALGIKGHTEPGG